MTATNLTDRELDRLTIADLIKESALKVDGGAMDGRTMVDLDVALGIIASTTMAPASAYASELAVDRETDGRVLVWTGCPRCGVPQPISAMVRARLTTEGDASELKPTFKAKARTHVCDQMPLPLDDAVSGQVKAW